MKSRIIGYDQDLEFDYQLAAERFCTIANKQVIPLFESLELELNEKDIKAAVTNRQTAKDIYSIIIEEATPKKDRGPLRRLLKSTGLSEFDTNVAKYGKETAAYNYHCVYNADTKRMEVDFEKIHKSAAIVVEGDMLAAYERVEAMVNAINEVCKGVVSAYELSRILEVLEVSLTEGKVEATKNLSKYSYIIEWYNTRLANSDN